MTAPAAPPDPAEPPEGPCRPEGEVDPPPPCASLRALVAGDCARLRTLRRQRWLWFSGVALGVSAALWALRQWVRPPSCEARGDGAGLAWGLVALVGLALVGLGFGLVGGRARALGRGAAVAAVFGGVGAGVAAWVRHGERWTAGGPGIGCLALGLAWGLALTGLAFWLGRGLRRRAAPSGLLFGVGGGLVALALLQTVCSVAGPLHALLGHGTVPALLGLLGVWLWKRPAPA